MPDLLTVMLCVNDPGDGSSSGFLREVSIDPELITVEGPFAWDDDGPDPGTGTTRFAQGDGLIDIEGATFKHRGYQTWVGNWCWDAVQMTPAETAKLLNFLKATGDWHCTVAESGLFDRWRKPGPLTVEDLEATHAR